MFLILKDTANRIFCWRAGEEGWKALEGKPERNRT